ncbi:hypothetical protein [Streptomyces sp. NBC_00503]|uniref:hypothetical protein n=1 Tax=Streptomyces sp. NBC_00503 TaxID=2903659 RepID=UPI002E804AF4|nr:hypothetical protein [Streptomyces sp. NBC_00503]WUD83162.1 hypothetical protein OG490_22835 [Streptomyces sp. NBC_00503]
MRAIRVASVALLSTAALALAAPMAAANDGGTTPNVTSFGFTVSPTTVAPGGTVTLNATGCQEPLVKASSGIFDAVELNEGKPATAKVDADAKPGAQYEVTFDCKGEKGTTTLTVAGHSTGTGTTTPSKGVKAGLGGGAGGLNGTEIAAGSALLAAALGGGVYLMRRRADGNA